MSGPVLHFPPPDDQADHPVIAKRDAQASVPFGGDLLRNPGPPAKPPRRERFIPIGYTLIFAVVFGFFSYVFLFNSLIDAFLWVFR